MSSTATLGVLFLLTAACAPPPPVHIVVRAPRCPTVVHVVDVPLARRPPHHRPEGAMCIADWACDEGYECNLDTFECEFALE